MYAGDESYIQEYTLKQNINIFNPRYKKDWLKLQKYCDLESIADCRELVYKVANEDWLNIWNWDRRQEFIEILRDLNYDGFVNFESSYGKIPRDFKQFFWEDAYSNFRNAFTGVGIFDEQKCLEKKQLYKNYEKFLTIPTFKREVDIQIEQLKEEIAKYCRDCKIKEINSTSLRYFNFSFCTALDWQTIFDVIKSLDAERHKIELKEKRLSRR